MDDYLDFITIDCETSGLNRDNNILLEIAYAVGSSLIYTIYPLYEPWLLEEELNNPANAKAWEVNKWVERFSDDVTKWPNNIETANQRDHDKEFDTFIERAKGRTPVGLNIDFDLGFINRYLVEPLPTHHRQLSLGPMALGMNMADGIELSFDHQYKPFSGKQVEEYVRALIFENFGPPEFAHINFPKIDHTAAGDVKATRFYHQVMVWHASGSNTRFPINFYRNR